MLGIICQLKRYLITHDIPNHVHLTRPHIDPQTLALFGQIQANELGYLTGEATIIKERHTFQEVVGITAGALLLTGALLYGQRKLSN